MDCLPNFSAFRNFFMRKRSTDAIETVGQQGPSAEEGDSSIFKDALHEKLDGVRPRSHQALMDLPKVARTLDRQLASKGDFQDIGIEGGRPVKGWRTQFVNIFRNVATDAHEFRMTMASGQVVKRSRKEIEIHILLQSHLRSKHGDPSVRDGAVLSVEQVFQPAPQRPAKRTRREHSPVEAGDELVEPLLERGERSDTSQWAPSASAVYQAPINNIVPAENPAGDSPAIDRSAGAHVGRQPSLVEEQGLATDLAIPATTPLLPSSAIPVRSTAQVEMTQFIEQRLHLPPIVFFEELSRRDPTVAAYLTAQALKMMTHVPAGERFQNDFVQSAHSDIAVQNFGHSEKFGHCTLADKSALRRTTVDGQAMMIAHRSLPAALLADFEKEVDRQNRLAINATGREVRSANRIFPIGLFGDRPRDQPTSNSMQVADVGRARLYELINMLDAVQGNEASELASAAEKIALVEPALAAFVGVVDRLLIFEGANVAASTERYHHADNGSPRDILMKPGPNGRDVFSAWPSSMLPGIEININAVGDGPGTWRMRQGDDYVLGKSKPEIIALTAREALRHLQLTAPDSDQQPIYPLIVYEMLANAVGLPVPAYLREHEQAVIDRVHVNQGMVHSRAARNAETSRVAAEARHRRALAIQQECAAKGVSNLEQLNILDENFDANRERIIGRSIDRSFTVAPENGVEMLRAIQTGRLPATHIRQAISSRYTPGGRHDNRCWLRTSWLALLSAVSPAELLSRHERLACDQNSRGHQSNGQVLRGIAERFHADPVGFLNIGTAGERWVDNSGKAAFLEHRPHTDEGDGHAATGSGNPVDTETFLLETQTSVAMCFRNEIPAIRREVQSLNSVAFPPGSSDLPITLHRAFGVPVLVIEAGERVHDSAGTASTVGIQIRAAAREDSELGRFIEAAALENLPLTEQSPFVDGLLHRFTDLPIIWLEAGHYELYLPSEFVSRFSESRLGNEA